jgi:hypothetical protein
MYWQWNKVLAISFVLAAAGILACIAALFDNLVPKGSLLAFLAAMIPLGLLIVGILIAFVWLCDKCEDYFSGSLSGSKEEDKDEPNTGSAGSGPRETSVSSSLADYRIRNDMRYHRITIDFPTSSRLRDRYLGSLRGFSLSNPAALAKSAARDAWHGQ